MTSDIKKMKEMELNQMLIRLKEVNSKRNEDTISSLEKMIELLMKIEVSSLKSEEILLDETDKIDLSESSR